MNLGEFLLARISEDVARAREVDATVEGLYWPDGGLAQIQRDWEAKRRIVEEYLAAAEETGEGLGVRLVDDAGIGLQRAVQLLAAVYADHEDYQESWRP